MKTSELTGASDRELLEMAAKAAGVEVKVVGGTFWTPDGITWNPLADDADALRLAVKLRIKFKYHEVLGQGLAWIPMAKEHEDARANIEECGRDECAATRRAIVRAAAEIGRQVEAIPAAKGVET